MMDFTASLKNSHERQYIKKKPLKKAGWQWYAYRVCHEMSNGRRRRLPLESELLYDVTLKYFN